MTTRPPEGDDRLKPRQEVILRTVVEEHIASGTPVGSKVIAGREGIDYAASTVRYELARLEDRFKRSVADLDNYRKRVARDIERQVTDERERFIRDWLEVVDSIDRALQHDPDGRLTEPLEVVRRQMDAVLTWDG